MSGSVVWRSPENATKQCPTCRKVKPHTEFFRQKTGGSLDGFRVRCKVCTTKQGDAWRAANPEKVWAFEINGNYGASVAAGDYDKLLAAQGGVCIFCSKPPQCGKRLEWDHCHDTGAFRGLAHGKCNRLEGHMRANIDAARTIMKLLEGKS